jgi:hypothetical protein
MAEVRGDGQELYHINIQKNSTLVLLNQDGGERVLTLVTTKKLRKQ